MNKDLQAIAHRAYKLGQVQGGLMVVEHKIKNLLDNLDLVKDDGESFDYTKEILEKVQDLRKILEEII
jgi:hypothetical protein